MLMFTSASIQRLPVISDHAVQIHLARRQPRPTKPKMKNIMLRAWRANQASDKFTVSCTERRNVEIKSRRQIPQRHLAPKKIRDRKGPSPGVIQKCEPHERNPCALQVRGEVTRGNLAPRKMRPQSSMGLGKKWLQAQKFGQDYIRFSYRSQANADAHFKISTGTSIRG